MIRDTLDGFREESSLDLDALDDPFKARVVLALAGLEYALELLFVTVRFDDTVMFGERPQNVPITLREVDAELEILRKMVGLPPRPSVHRPLNDAHRARA